MLNVNVDRYHTTNRTATTNGPISLAHAAQWAGYVLHPLIKSNRTYFPNLFDDKASKYYFK